MEIAGYIDALGREGGLLAEAAAEAGPGASVPSCPDWLVRDLVRHQGGVHRWATAIVSGPRAESWDADLDDVVGSWPDDAELISWFAQGHARLVEALSQASPDLACWTFLAAPSPLAMWSRRQAHETAVHRVDAELAAGRPVTGFPAEFAADGIDELLACFITRPRGRLRADPPRSLRVSCSDTPGDWLVRIEPDRVRTTAVTDTAADGRDAGLPGAADCVVTGTAEDLYLALWNRRANDGLAVGGDAGVLGLFTDRVRVRWR